MRTALLLCMVLPCNSCDALTEEATRTPPPPGIQPALDRLADGYLVDTAGYTVALVGGRLYRKMGESERQEGSGSFGSLEDRYLPLHQTPEGLRAMGSWGAMKLGDSTEYISNEPTAFFDERTATEVIVDREGRFASITSTEEGSRGYGYEVRWDFDGWRAPEEVGDLVRSRVGRLLME